MGVTLSYFEAKYKSSTSVETLQTKPKSVQHEAQRLMMQTVGSDEGKVRCDLTRQSVNVNNEAYTNKEVASPFLIKISN